MIRSGHYIHILMVASLFATLAHTKSVPLTGGFLEAHSPAVAEEKFLRRLCYSFIELSRSVFRVLFSLSLTAVMAFAQVDTGTPANTTSENDGRVTINLSNLNIHVDIPLRSSNARNLFAKVTMSTDSSIQKLGTTLSHSNVLSDLPPFFAHGIIRHFLRSGLRLRTAEPVKRSRPQTPSSL